MGKIKKEDDTFLWKKTEEKQNTASIMKSVDGKRNNFSNEVEITKRIV